ncbi:MAG: SDR family NAD(P)-dependent oxidoreductase [Pseudomonadota bacterium]
MTAPRDCVVVGAGGPLGFEIARLLAERGARVRATYRTPKAGLADALEQINAEAVQFDISDAEAAHPVFSNVDTVIATPILTVSRQLTRHLKASARSIFLSSNNVAIDPDAPVYRDLIAAETAVAHTAPNAIILRPTMIYGHAQDGNLSGLMQAMRRFPVVPMIGSGEAMQQPVFYRDLAAAAVALASDEAWRPGVRAVAGPAPLSTRRLYNEVRAAARARCVFAPLPGALVGVGLKALNAVGIATPISAAQIRRAGLDKTPVGETITAATPLGDGLAVLSDALDGALDAEGRPA